MNKESIKITNNSFTKEEQQLALQFANQIDIHDIDTIKNYNSKTTLIINEILKIIYDMLHKNNNNTKIDDIRFFLDSDYKIHAPEKHKFDFLKTKQARLNEIKSIASHSYSLVKSLHESTISYGRDITMQLVDINKFLIKIQLYMKELTIFSLACVIKLEDTINGELKSLVSKAAETGLHKDMLNANDLKAICNYHEESLLKLLEVRRNAIPILPHCREFVETLSIESRTLEHLSTSVISSYFNCYSSLDNTDTAHMSDITLYIDTLNGITESIAASANDIILLAQDTYRELKNIESEIIKTKNILSHINRK